MRLLKGLRHGEEGQILLLVLIIFALGSLGIAPLLSFMSTGIAATRSEGLRTQQIYAAEAGVRDAFWKVQRVVPGLPKQLSDPPLQYTLPASVNGASVNATITLVNTSTYRIHSIAAHPDKGRQSGIDSDITIGTSDGVDLSAFTSFALTSPGTITTKSSDIISGNVWVSSPSDYSGVPPSGNLTFAPVTGWPTAAQLETYFSYQVDKSAPYSSSTIDVSQPGMSGPLYAAGYSNGDYVLTGTGALTGVIYVVGNLSFDNHAHIELNGWTVFVTGSVTTSPQSYVGGPGAIIALGSINFSPQVSPNFIFVMSISGQVNFQPQGDFVGAVAGDTNINLQPNCTLTWEDPGVGNLNMPGLFNTITSIKTWAIR